MVDNREIWADSIKPGLKKYLVDGFNRHPMEIDRFFKMETSSRAYEETKTAYSFGQLVQTAEGQPSVLDFWQDGYLKRFTHLDYSKQHIVTHKEYADDLYGIWKGRGEKFGKSVAETVNTKGMSVFVNAFSTSYLGADAKPLCSTSHPREDGGSAQSNASNTNIALTEANLETGLNALYEVKDGRGNILNLLPFKATLLVQVAQRKEALILTQSELRPGTGNNDYNYYYGNVDVMVNQYFSVLAGGSDTSWFLILPEVSGLTFFWREQPTLDNWVDKETRNMHISVWCSFSYGWTWWYGVWGSQGTGTGSYTD